MLYAQRNHSLTHSAILLTRTVTSLKKTLTKNTQKYPSTMADRIRSHQAAMATHPPGIVVEIVGTLMGESGACSLRLSAGGGYGRAPLEGAGFG
jgi:hypothetical protein